MHCKIYSCIYSVRNYLAQIQSQSLKSTRPQTKTTQAFLISRGFKIIFIACNESEHLGQVCASNLNLIHTEIYQRKKSVPMASLQYAFPHHF